MAKSLHCLRTTFTNVFLALLSECESSLIKFCHWKHFRDTLRAEPPSIFYGAKKEKETLQKSCSFLFEHAWPLLVPNHARFWNAFRFHSTASCQHKACMTFVKTPTKSLFEREFASPNAWALTTFNSFTLLSKNFLSLCQLFWKESAK